MSEFAGLPASATVWVLSRPNMGGKYTQRFCGVTGGVCAHFTGPGNLTFRATAISRSGATARLRYDEPRAQDRTQGLPKGAN